MAVSNTHSAFLFYYTIEHAVEGDLTVVAYSGSRARGALASEGKTWAGLERIIIISDSLGATCSLLATRLLPSFACKGTSMALRVRVEIDVVLVNAHHKAGMACSSDKLERKEEDAARRAAKACGESRLKRCARQEEEQSRRTHRKRERQRMGDDDE